MTKQQGKPSAALAARDAAMSYSTQQSDDLRALANSDFWLKEQARTPEIDKLLAKARGF